MIFDLETHMTAPGLLAPPIVCCAYESGANVELSRDVDAVRVALPKAHFANHNIAFDFACVAQADPLLFPQIFEAYDSDRVTDTMLREQLLDIKDGQDCAHRSYSLTNVHERRGFGALDKGWQTGYEPLDGVPLEDWPPEALHYPCDDVRAARRVLDDQGVSGVWLQDQYRQARAAFALQLVSAWGLRVDKPRVDKLEEDLRRDLEIDGRELEREGLLRRGKDGLHKSMKPLRERIAKAYADAGRPVPLVKGHDDKEKRGRAIATDKIACRESGDKVLERFARYSIHAARLAKDVPLLRGSDRVHTRHGLAASGRVTHTNPNTANLPAVGGVRECFIPSEGCVFLDTDYEGLELRTWAQVCLDLFGESKLAEAINNGIDPHTEVASELLGIDYQSATARKKAKEKTFDLARQVSKIVNFGKPGAMSAAVLQSQALAKYDMRLTLEQCEDASKAWFRKWPEAQLYFRHISAQVGRFTGVLEQHRSARFRLCGYTDGCNTLFQGLGADCAKDALYRVVRACYAEPTSPLFGCRVVLFGHDQLITEAPEHRADAAGDEQSRLMLAAAKDWIPDVSINAETILCRRFSKSATSTVTDGRRSVWDG